MKTERIQNIITILIIIGLLIYLVITRSIPSIKNTFGSSDSLLKTSAYVNLIDLKVNNNLNIGFILNKDKKIYHVFFYDENSFILYNQDIEKQKLDKSLDIIISKLIEKDYLKENANVTLTKYNSKYYDDFKKSFNKALAKYKVDINLIEKTSTLKQLAKSLDIDYTDKSRVLFEIDILLKNQKGLPEDNTSKEKEIDSNNLKKYSNNIYISIEKYMNKNNIINEELNKTKLDITKISGDEEGLILPSKESYYYIKNSKVYAYIKLTVDEKVAEYCYNGSIDEYKEGVC